MTIRVNTVINSLGALNMTKIIQHKSALNVAAARLDVHYGHTASYKGCNLT
jgi:hypothetical protein